MQLPGCCTIHNWAHKSCQWTLQGCMNLDPCTMSFKAPPSTDKGCAEVLQSLIQPRGAQQQTQEDSTRAVTDWS